MQMIKKYIAGFQYALRRIWLAFRHEGYMSFHLVAAVVVLIVNYLLKITQTEWIITIILIGLVWMAEIFNTAIEKLADRVNSDYDPMIGLAKDLAAGAVLIICLVAVICALIIYWPHVF